MLNSLKLLFLPRVLQCMYSLSNGDAPFEVVVVVSPR
jgi:hypothetical protein